MTYFALSFLMTSVVMSLIIIIALLVGNMFPKIFTAKLRYTAWIIILIGLIIPIRPLLGTGIIDIPVPTQAQGVSEGQIVGRQPTTTDTMTPVMAAGNTGQELNQGLNRTAGTQIFDAHLLIDILLLVWLIPAVLIFGYHLLKYAKFRRLIKRWSKPITDDAIITLFETIKEQKKVRRCIELKKSKLVSTSMLIGFWRPMILLPEKNFDNEELTMIFLHELTHYKRGDLYVKLASVAVLAIHWFNPVIYFMSNAMQADCEASCDEAVLMDVGGDNRQFYAELIMEMMGGRKSQGTLLSTCFFASTRGIKVRLSAIMDAKKAIRGLAAVTFAMLIFQIMLSGSVFAITPTQPNIPAVMSTYQGITLTQAREIALSLVPGGTLQRIEAGYADDGLILGVAVLQENRTYRMIFDASNGVILRLHIQSPHETHGISLSQAIQIAHNDLVERGISATFRISSGIDWEYAHWVWELEFDSDLGLIEYYIDINTGWIVNTVVHDN